MSICKPHVRKLLYTKVKSLPEIIIASSTNSLESNVLPTLGKFTPSVIPLFISSLLAGFLACK